MPIECERRAGQVVTAIVRVEQPRLERLGVEAAAHVPTISVTA